MIQYLKELFAGVTVERAIIEGRDPTRDEAAAAMKRSRDFTDNLLRDQHRVVSAIAEWSRDTINRRCAQRLPPNLPRSIPLVQWLPGLSVLEISNMKAAALGDLEDHIYYGHLIAGVRAVQPLEPAVLKFPPRVAPAEDRNAVGGGGGPVRRMGGRA